MVTTTAKGYSSMAGDAGGALADLVRVSAGNRKALAEHLGLSERTLYRRLKALRLDN